MNKNIGTSGDGETQDRKKILWRKGNISFKSREKMNFFFQKIRKNSRYKKEMAWLRHRMACEGTLCLRNCEKLSEPELERPARNNAGGR